MSNTQYAMLGLNAADLLIVDGAGVEVPVGEVSVRGGPDTVGAFAATAAADVKGVVFEVCDRGAYLVRVGWTDVDARDFGARRGTDDILAEPAPTNGLRDRAT